LENFQLKHGSIKTRRQKAVFYSLAKMVEILGRSLIGKSWCLKTTEKVSQPLTSNAQDKKRKKTNNEDNIEM